MSDNITKIHFIGIGGSSMSGLAKIALSQGKRVSGSDQKTNSAIEELKELGATIYMGHHKEAIIEQQPDLVVYTVAISIDNMEYQEALAEGIKTIDRAEYLGMIMKNYNHSISIAGTHGKTTTTSMISSILLDNGVDPSIHIGGVLPLIHSNTYIGKGDCFVTEACEYHHSFLKLHTTLGIILNVEHDHVDYYKTMDDFRKAFQDFVATIPGYGYCVLCADDKEALGLRNFAKCNVITYGINNPDAQWQAKDIKISSEGKPSYDLYHNGSFVEHIDLGTRGTHNVLNSLAALAAANVVGVKPQDCIEPLKTFKGSSRRFEIIGTKNGAKIVDDYAHHPTEIRATMDSALAAIAPDKKLWIVFQPHTYTRTEKFTGTFATSFEGAHQVIITDVYAAREKNVNNISSSTIADIMNKNKPGSALYQPDFHTIVKYLASNVKEGDMVICVGAGDVNQIGYDLID